MDDRVFQAALQARRVKHEDSIKTRGEWTEPDFTEPFHGCALTESQEVEELLQEAEEEEAEEEEDTEEVEEEVEEISEMEMLAWLDKQEDALQICQRLLCYNSVPDAHKLGTSLQVLGAEHLQDLLCQGWTVLDGLLTAVELKVIRTRVQEMIRRQELTPACNMHSAEQDPHRDGSARGDSIRWVSPQVLAAEFPSIHRLLVDRLVPDFHRIMQLRGVVEHQLAAYPSDPSDSHTTLSPSHVPLSRYERHRDAFPVDDPTDQEQRRLTCILYLQECQDPREWKQEFGGHLGVYARPTLEETTTPTVHLVEPVGGRCVLFLSGAIDHEVQLAHKDRYALTTWLR